MWSIVFRCAVFLDMFDCGLSCVAVWTGVCCGINYQSFLVAQESLVVSTSESSEVDFIFTGEKTLGRLDINTQ